MNLAVANHHVPPVSGDPMGIVLLFKRAGQQVMNVAVLNGHVLGEDANAIPCAIVDLAIPQSHSVCGDLDDVSARALGIHENVLIHSWLRDLEEMDELLIGERAYFTKGAGEFGWIRSKSRCDE